jgi:hypothetical protein
MGNSRVLTLLVAPALCVGCTFAARAMNNAAGQSASSIADVAIPCLVLLYALAAGSFRTLHRHPAVGLYLCGSLYLLGWPSYLGQEAWAGLLRGVGFLVVPFVAGLYFFVRCFWVPDRASPTE